MKILSIKVFGTSMLPFIKDEYLFVKIGSDNIKIGDIVLYKFLNRLYVHRVYKVDDKEVIISNDDDLSFHNIKREDIIGKVLSFWNGYSGYILGWLLRYFRNFKKILYECF
ncbi:MAG: S24/S26 family peptidase [Elusimicrobiales bacterium]|nr:S24/S26 family peptidase [Elusimicrobiales bacterium]